jgi:cysteine synthase A
MAMGIGNASTILQCIGNTPLVELGPIRPAGCARILVKLESANPTGSMKDRMALEMIEAAERDGRLKPGGHVVEYTAGSTGVSLAFICAVKGYSLSIVTSDAFSVEKRDQMAAYGAELTLVHSEDGGMNAALTRDMIAKAADITRRTGGFWTNQLNNPDQIAAYHRMGEEIWQQTGGRVDAFVQSVGSAASARGVSEALHARNASIRCVAVEPRESAVLSGGPSGVHRIEGVGPGFVTSLWRRESMDAIESVSSGEAMQAARALARHEGIFAGTSSGANLAVALRLGQQLGPQATIVTLVCDSGMKYLSTELFGAARPPAETAVDA